MLEFDIKIGAKDLYDYNLRHNYSSTSGIAATAFGALVLIVGILKETPFFVIGGIVLLLYLPVTLYIKSAQAALAPVYKTPLHYVLDDEGMEVSQGELTTRAPWEGVVKAVSSGRSIIVYTSRVNATIFPKAQLGDRTASLIEMISTHIPPDKVKIRG